jgi:RsiW-degrading membrane proteinase PrsW (M82 family)
MSRVNVVLLTVLAPIFGVLCVTMIIVYSQYGRPASAVVAALTGMIAVGSAALVLFKK